MMILWVDITAQVVSKLQCRMRTGILQLLPKETDGAQHQACLISFFQQVRQFQVCRRLAQIALYTRRPFRCVLTETRCRMWLVWSREHAFWASQ
ncbi:hypothetical protein TNCV_3918471 [Trichonephila clavipes]|nr:hypothetical protein TNCV_3918471 [Trichonephila clavipes]